MNKKAVIFLGSILVLILITIGFIVFVQIRAKSGGTQLTSTNSPAPTPSPSTSPNPAPQPNPTPAPTPDQTPTPAPPAGNAPVKISDVAAVGPVLSYDSTLLWYFSADGHLFKVNIKSGLKQEYVLPNNYPVSQVIWPPVGNDFIIQTTGGSAAKTFYYYNSQTKNFIPYPANVKEVDYMPDGLHVAYEWVDDKGAASLSIANFDLTGHKTISAMPDPDDVIKVSPQRNRAFYYKANALNDGKIYYVDLDTGKTVQIKTAADNRVIWSPDSTHFLYTRLDKDNNAASTQLWLGDIDTISDSPLGVNIPVTKAAFDRTGSNIYVALPNSGSGDHLVGYDLKTSNTNEFYKGGSGSSAIDATDLMITNDGNTILFMNSDGFVYSLPITH